VGTLVGISSDPGTNVVGSNPAASQSNFGYYIRIAAFLSTQFGEKDYKLIQTKTICRFSPENSQVIENKD
jgi:hypothetical protein